MPLHCYPSPLRALEVSQGAVMLGGARLSSNLLKVHVEDLSSSAWVCRGVSSAEASHLGETPV